MIYAKAANVKEKNRGPTTEPCRTPHDSTKESDKVSNRNSETVNNINFCLQLRKTNSTLTQVKTKLTSLSYKDETQRTAKVLIHSSPGI